MQEIDGLEEPGDNELPSNKARPGGMSKKMMIVIALILLVLIVPSFFAMVASATVSVTVRNTDPTEFGAATVSVYGALDEDPYVFTLYLAPSQEQTITCKVHIGENSVFVYWTFYGSGGVDYHGSDSEDYSVGAFQTEKMEFVISNPLIP